MLVLDFNTPYVRLPDISNNNSAVMKCALVSEVPKDHQYDYCNITIKH